MYSKINELNDIYKEKLFQEENIKTEEPLIDKSKKTHFQSLLYYKESYTQIKNFFIIIILTILFISFTFNKNTNVMQIFKIDIQEDDRNSTLRKGIEYIKMCFQGKLQKKIPNLHKNTIPLVSIVIPIYNANKTIDSVVRSIQNQNLSNFEIILINDFSKDNSLQICKNLKKEDSRIKVMNNIKNMGTLYSRNIGTLTAKGEYIFALDNDDLFITDDLLYIIYGIAKQDNFDIVNFKSIKEYSYNPKIDKIKDDGFYNHKHNLIVNQPQLGLFTISRNNRYRYNDVYIWGKAIKTEIYKKAINMMGKERYSEFVTWAEDTSMTFIIYNIAKSLKCVRKYGIFHVRNNECASVTQSNAVKCFGEIFLIDIFYDFSKNNNDKNYAAYQALALVNGYQRKFLNVKNNKKNSDYLKKNLEKLLNSKYISEKNKDDIKKSYKKVEFYNGTKFM